MKTTLITTILLFALSFSTALNAQTACPSTNKMQDGSCIMIEYGSAESASKAISTPVETLVVSESTDEASNGVYIAMQISNETEVVYTKADPCAMGGYDGTIVGKFKFTIADMVCEYDALGVLPVDFSFFKASTQEEMALLQWGTSSETDNDGFYIEKSSDGQFFQEFAFIVGEGTSSEELEYETLDRDPFGGVNYYRLKQVDYNGNERYSKIVKLDFRGSDGVTVSYHNGNQEIAVRSGKTLQSIEIFDMAGVRVHKSMLDKNLKDHTVSFAPQTSGHFVAVVTDKNGNVETTKFSKL